MNIVYGSCPWLTNRVHITVDHLQKAGGGNQMPGLHDRKWPVFPSAIEHNTCGENSAQEVQSKIIPIYLIFLCIFQEYITSWKVSNSVKCSLQALYIKTPNFQLQEKVTVRYMPITASQTLIKLFISFPHRDHSKRCSLSETGLQMLMLCDGVFHSPHETRSSRYFLLAQVDSETVYLTPVILFHSS